MRIIPFSVLKDKLIDRSKCQTIRTDKGTTYYQVGKEYKAVFNARRPSREVLGAIRITNIRKVLGKYLTEQDALLDGVSSLSELTVLLKKLNKNKDIEDTKFLIITYRWF